jgi:formylglycine-generating enzyme
MKIKLHLPFIVMVFLAGVHSAPAQPALGIMPADNQALLFWPSNATSYGLQSSTNLASTNWVFATDAIPATYGSQTAVTVTNTLAARFFRLISVPTTTSDGMALVPAGSFTMGDYLINGSSITNDPDITDANPTNVYVSAFYMDTNLVSSNQWQLVYSRATNNGYSFDEAGSGKAGNHPVQTVDWFDCVKWSNARSQQAGLTPVYYTDADLTQLFTNGDYGTTVYANWSANGYRLPTEAEWEKAARGGLSGQRFPWGDTISWSQANYYGYPGSLGGYAYDLSMAIDFDPAFSGGDNGDYPYTSPVGSFAPNGYGLYDMAGNVWEWCWDWYAGLPYPAGSPYLGGTDPRGAASSPYGYRVLRGGVWDSVPGSARCAYRYLLDPSYAADVGGGGFRCVRGL